MKQTTEFLKATCNQVRFNILESIHSAGKGHVGGSFSIVEVLVALYYDIMRVDSNQPDLVGRDRFVLSKGHAGPALYAVLVEKGYLDSKILMTLNQAATSLPSHPDMHLTRGVDMTTGSLGQGFSAAVGMAYASYLSEDGAYIYTIIGDGESQEGQVWEAALAASARRLDHLIAFTDYNKIQLDGNLEDILPMGDLEAKWRAFGFETRVIDGHDIEQIIQTVKRLQNDNGQPKMIILNTVKGKGLHEVETLGYKNHSMPVTEETLTIAKQVLKIGGNR